MRVFVLVDLATQMPYLPDEMRTWSRERVLSWLRLYGEVFWHGDSARFAAPLKPQEAAHLASVRDLYTFSSWSGATTSFVLSKPGEMRIPGSWVRAWNGSPSST